ncbi:MAG: Hsp20/alpha crystallin family protein [bacterium]
MKIVRYREPNRVVPSRFNWMEDLFSEFFNNSLERVPAESSFPKVDIEEDEKSYLFKIELPGVKKEDISIEIDNRVLTVSGEKKEEKEEKSGNVFRKESYSGSFSRSFTLPEHVSPDEADAKCVDGILFLSIPKSEEKSKKKIDIK